MNVWKTSTKGKTGNNNNVHILTNIFWDWLLKFARWRVTINDLIDVPWRIASPKIKLIIIIDAPHDRNYLIIQIIQFLASFSRVWALHLF